MVHHDALTPKCKERSEVDIVFKRDTVSQSEKIRRLRKSTKHSSYFPKKYLNIMHSQDAKIQ